jgi:HAD superfamily hydrolase (TIGR01509 family)
MSAILFGSIGSIAETSELQRQAFNQAFEVHGLDWHWPRERYQKLLVYSGGEQRIAAWAKGHKVDAHAIHETKSKIYQTLLAQAGVLPRSGVLDTIRAAQQHGIKVGLVSATSPDNVTQLISALHPHLHADDFDVMVNSSFIKLRKPAPDAYVYALGQLGLSAQDCIAIEDNEDGVAAAVAAGISCVAFPGANTADHNYSAAIRKFSHLQFDELIALIPNYKSTSTSAPTPIPIPTRS